MTGQQLRNSILQEAIQGRLVPHNQSDESAEMLLSRIRKQRIELAKVGKIKKKDLDSEPISAEEIPFEIPRGWAFARLSEISLDSADGPFGSNLKKEHYTDQKQVRIIQLSNIGELGWKDTNVKYTTFEHLNNISRSEAFAGDVIIAKMMPAGRAIICPDNDLKYVLSSDAVRFEFSSFLDKRYLYYALNSPVFKEQVYGEVQGITRVRTSLSKLRTYVLPIPPLSEQKAIVEKIEELFPLVDEYEKAAVELNALNEILPDKLRKSVLQEAIHGNLVPNDIPDGEVTAQGLLQQILKERQDRENKEKGKKAKRLTLSTIEEEPWELPDGWCWCKLGDIGSWGAGATPQRGNAAYYQEGIIPWLKTGELNNGVVYDTEEKVTEIALQQCSLRLCQPDDVLIAMYGATIGKLAIAGVPLTTNQACCACTPYTGIHNKYLFFFLLAKKDDFTKQAFGGAQPNISKEKIVGTDFPLPPLSIQHRIVEKIEEVFSAIEKLQA